MNDEKTIYNFKVNSFDVKAEYYKNDINTIFIPLVKRLGELAKNSDGKIIVYIAGPCGSGKSTVSLLLESLVISHTNSFAQSVGIDGFHYNREYLNCHYTYGDDGEKILLRDVKGSPETYDFDKLYGKISALKHSDIYFPTYDRLIHDVVEDAIFVNGRIVIVEGNWLLLDEPRWRDLSQFCDYGIFIDANRDTLISRLTERKITGGLSVEDAKKFVMRSDVKNIERILDRRLKCDLSLKIEENGRYTIKN